MNTGRLSWIIMLNPLIYVAIAFASISTINAQCNVQTGISTTKTQVSDGTYMTNVGDTESTFIECNLACINCSLDYLFWIKDGQSVYGRWWTTAGTTGPEPPFEGRVNPNIKENNGSYVLEWNQTRWDDLPDSSNSTQWECYFEVTSCFYRRETMDVEYFREPLPSLYINDKLVENCNDITTDVRPLNCTVLSHPESIVSLRLGDEIVSNDYSCSPYSAYEYICSLSVPDISFSMGYYCMAEYASPESGLPERTQFLTCLVLQGLETWEIVLISVACTCVVVGASAGGVYLVKSKKLCSRGSVS